MEKKIFIFLQDYLGIQCSKINGSNTLVNLSRDNKETKAITCVVSNVLFLRSKCGISASTDQKTSSFGVHMHPNSSFNSTNKDVKIQVQVYDKIEIHFEESLQDSLYHQKTCRMTISNEELSVSFNDLGMRDGAKKIYLEIKRSGNDYFLYPITEIDIIDPDNPTEEGSININSLPEPIKCSYAEAIQMINANDIFRDLIPSFMNLVRELSPTLREKILELYPWIKQFIPDNDSQTIKSNSTRIRLPSKN